VGDAVQIKSAAKLKPGSSGSSTFCESVLESAKEDVEQVRDELQRFNNALTAPSLEDLCKSFHAISMVNQRMLDQIECQLEADPALNYQTFASKNQPPASPGELTHSDAHTSPTSLPHSQTASTSAVPGCATGGGASLQHNKGIKERCSVGSNERSSFGSLSERYSDPALHCSSPLAASLPSHLQVHPKTPDLGPRPETRKPETEA
jgi:hypothetical protein